MKDLFYSGNYRQILTATVDSREGHAESADLPFVIGALTFRGRLHEAELLFRLRLADFCPVSIFFARFFLGVGHCRVSHYKEARRLFGVNLRLGAHHDNMMIRFLAWQGLGFYRLFSGQYQRGFVAARRALDAALEGNYLYGKALASDLMAHNQIVPGEVSSALTSFDEAINYARLLGDGGLLQAVTVSRAIHSAQFGLDSAHDLRHLEELSAHVTAEDNYTQSRLLLEIGRQHMLRGDVADARDTLNRACQLIYSSKNRRYSIMLNLRYAYLAHLAADQHQALNLVRNAAKELDPVVDRSLELEVIGLERRILAALAPAAPASGPEFLSERSGKAINRRIVGRERALFQSQRFLGDDPLGDLIDLAHTNPDAAASEIISRGYLGLLPPLVAGAAGARLIYFDLVPGSVIVFNRGQVRHEPNASSSVIRAIARELMAQEVTKQDLIERTWGYRYNASKHDSLVYRSVSRFRALLGPYADWLEVTESGYRLTSGVAVAFHRAAPPPTAVVTVAVPVKDATRSAPMNLRQRRILNVLAERNVIDARSCLELFGVSEMTARRDLSELLHLGLVARVGKGRATHYTLSVPAFLGT